MSDLGKRPNDLGKKTTHPQRITARCKFSKSLYQREVPKNTIGVPLPPFSDSHIGSTWQGPREGPDRPPEAWGIPRLDTRLPLEEEPSTMLPGQKARQSNRQRQPKAEGLNTPRLRSGELPEE